MLEKYCAHCDTWKPITEFHKNQCRKDGHNTQCKSCVAERFKKNYSRYKKSNGKEYKPRQDKKNVYFKLIYCPENSWGHDSRFTKIEIIEMLKPPYCLFAGTKFQCRGKEYIITENMQLRKLDIN